VFEPRQTSWEDSGTHPTFYQTATGGSYPGVKPPEREAEHSDPSSKTVKLSLYFFLAEHHAMKVYCGSGCVAPLIL
jgi:hypothetical protein